MPNKLFIFYGFFFWILFTFSIYHKFIFNAFNQIPSFSYLFEKEDTPLCTTKWYQQYHLEFEAFSIENFSQVIFLMDHSYSNVFEDGTFKCVFSHYGKCDGKYPSTDSCIVF